MKSTAILTFLFIAIALNCFGQKMSIGYIYPAGGQVGTSFEIEVGGLNVTQATDIFISGKGVKAELIPASESAKKQIRKKFDDQSSPQLADKLKVRITLDKNATVGLRDFRLQAAKGVSNKLTFEVGQYHDVREKGVSGLQKPNIVSALPATLCGQILPGERDCFSFTAQRGAKLVAAVKARTFVPYIADAVPGWFQAVISLRNSKGREVAFADDYRNNVDPVLIFEVPESDTYTLMIHDAIFRGREDFNYRIDLGEIPYIQYIYPAIGKKNKASLVNIKAVNIDKKAIKFKPEFDGKSHLTVTGKDNFVSNSVPFYSVGAPKIIAKQGNTDLTDMNVIIYDSISHAATSKVYYVNLLKNESFVAEITARRLGSMLDARLSLYDASGKKIAEADDTEDAMEGLMTHHADPVLKYKALNDGKYKLIVEDVLQESGEDYFYMLERKTAAADFEVFVSPANITIPRGGTATFMLDIISSDKKIPRINLELLGLPRGFVTGSMDVQGNKWEVSVTAPLKAKEQKLDLKVMATTKAAGKDAAIEIQQAVAADNMMQAFYYTHHIPAVNFVAEVTKEAPFSLHFAPEIERNLHKPILVSITDTVLMLKVELRRKEGFTDNVSLQLNRKNKQIVLDPVEFKANENEKLIPVKLNLKELAKYKGVRRQLSIVGTVNGEVDKRGKRSFENAQYRETTPVILIEIGK